METSQDILYDKLGKVALVHDFLLYPGGAERVLRAFADMFSEAPIYTLLYDSEKMGEVLSDREVRSSFLGSWPRFLRKRHRLLLPFYATAAESFDLRDFDTVISSSGAWTKGIVTRLYTKHLAYLHSPMRYAWDANETYLQLTGGLHFWKRLGMSSARLWDFEAAARPDVLVANSQYTADRVRKYYRREARVVYPPVAALSSEAVPNHEKKFFLTVSRLSEYKRIDRIVRAFSENGLPLVVVGEGRELKRLKQMASSNIRFLGSVPDAKLAELYGRARAFVFAAEEDFGLAIAEAQFAGVPAIAFSAGGAREIIDDGKTGVFFHELSVQALQSSIRLFLDRETAFDANEIQKSAQRFSVDQFRKGIEEVLWELVGERG